MTSLTIKQIKVGDSSSASKKITDEMVRTFAEVSGDKNPVHLDDAYAAKTMFKERISHGMLVASMFSAIFGTQLPGEGAIYLSQSVKFVAPVKLNDTITATVTAKEILLDRNRVIFDTVCVNQNGEKVIVGEAVLMPKKE